MNKSIAKTNSNDLNPWSLLKNDIWDVFEKFTEDLEMPLSSQEFVPKIEVKDKGNSYQVCAEVPGMDEKDINVTLKENSLIIEGEKKNEVKNEDKKKGIFHSEFNYGRFYRAIPLGNDIDSEKVKANYRNGVLMVELEKLPEKATKHRKIEISSSSKDSSEGETKH